MKRVFSTILLLLVLSFSYPIFSQQRNVVINTSSVDRTVITTDPDVDIWTQLEQERIAAERAEQARIAAERVEQESIATENADQAHIADKKGTQPIAITNDFQTKCAQIHKQIIKLSEHYYGGQVLKKYNNIYKSMPQTEENMLNLQKIQYVVISYLNSKGSAYPTLEKELKNAASVEEEISPVFEQLIISAADNPTIPPEAYKDFISPVLLQLEIVIILSVSV